MGAKCDMVLVAGRCAMSGCWRWTDGLHDESREVLVETLREGYASEATHTQPVVPNSAIPRLGRTLTEQDALITGKTTGSVQVNPVRPAVTIDSSAVYQHREQYSR